ncbi:MAG: hypothetical protein CVU77_08200 [Elusimicrobia bacterium HGW-Elusimicrobia-1]|jgi:hypothetical protein|nr:MAG: hypothetical protein CVU77_08200 [Elusimicrobia bacterium HGW-Elusimicrobia-1]
MNNKTISMILSAAIFALAIAAKDAFAQRQISTSVGDVKILSAGAERPAASGEKLAVGDKVKTSAASRVEILDGESKVWVRENSEVEISNAPEKESVFSLLVGRLRAKVKLMQGSKFNVRTPVSVASVRGTDFAMDSGGQLLVFEGAVDFGDLAMSAPSVVEAGMLAKFDDTGSIQKEAVSPEQMQQYEQEWQDAVGAPSGDQGKAPSEGEKSEDKKKAEVAAEKDEIAAEMAEMRREIREMVREIRSDIVLTRDLTNEIKQADIASGRTLIDRFGNLVRVEQQLLRPTNDTLQIVNITKRDSYKYSGFFPGAYTGPSSARVDIMDSQVTFSQAVPSDIAKWPAFFGDGGAGKDIKVDKTRVSMSNRTDTIMTVGTRKTVTEDETYTYWVNGQWAVISGDGSVWVDGHWETETRTVTKDKMDGEVTINGWKVNKDYDPKLDGHVGKETGVAISDDESLELTQFAMWAKSPEIKVEKDGVTKYVSMWTENYGINNSGGLLSEASFASADSNPFDTFKKIAFQNVLFVKEINKDTGAVTGDLFGGRNIDLVYTPDLAVAAATKLLTSGVDFGKFKTSDSSSSQ